MGSLLVLILNKCKLFLLFIFLMKEFFVECRTVICCLMTKLVDKIGKYVYLEEYHFMKKVLIAEDEPVLRMLIMDTLEDEGYDLDEAADGMEALEKIKAIDFDLIILDYMMPRLTGIEVIEQTRQLETRKDSKILMLSAKNQQAEQDKVLFAGADEFMSKPFSPLELIVKVEEMLCG